MTSHEQESKSSLPKQFPKGIRLGKDGKPCRNCSSFASWASLQDQKGTQPATTDLAQQQQSNISASAPSESPSHTHAHDPLATCPPDVERLGSNSWTLLHTISATYPTKPSASMREQTSGFLKLFAQLYPCSHCAEDFQSYMKNPATKPRLDSRDEFGQWMCEAHNDVNRKLGKDEFDCSLWKQRWRTGWKDGRCGFYDEE